MWLPDTRPSRNALVPTRIRWTGILIIFVSFLGGCDPDYPTTTWADPAYDHTAIAGEFELTGPHEGAACTGCHEAGNMELRYDPAGPQDCQACHSADFQAQHAGSGYPTACLICHSGQEWERAPFDHGTESGGFVLFGPHADLACVRCHLPDTFAPRFNPTNDQDCQACHF